VCDLETSRMGVPYVYDTSRLRVKSVLDIHKSDFISSSNNTKNLEAITNFRSAQSVIYTSQDKEKLFLYTGVM
jgi:hypothetical protein